MWCDGGCDPVTEAQLLSQWTMAGKGGTPVCLKVGGGGDETHQRRCDTRPDACALQPSEQHSRRADDCMETSVGACERGSAEMVH